MACEEDNTFVHSHGKERQANRDISESKKHNNAKHQNFLFLHILVNAALQMAKMNLTQCL